MKTSITSVIAALFFAIFLLPQTGAAQVTIQKSAPLVLQSINVIKGEIRFSKRTNLFGKTPTQIAQGIAARMSVHLYDPAKFNGWGQQLMAKNQVIEAHTAAEYVFQYKTYNALPLNKPLVVRIKEIQLGGGGLGGTYMFFGTNPLPLIATLTARDNIFEGYNFKMQIQQVPH